MKEKTSKDLAYLGRGLAVPPCVDILPGTHPVTNKLVGQRLTFTYKDYTYSIEFADEEKVLWWFETGVNAGTLMENPYVAFEITENIYFVCWVEATTPALNAKGMHHGAWLTSFVLDLDKMVATDAYMNPDEEDRDVFYLAQARVTPKE